LDAAGIKNRKRQKASPNPAEPDDA
jgi:hypothetical protein